MILRATYNWCLWTHLLGKPKGSMGPGHIYQEAISIISPCELVAIFHGNHGGKYSSPIDPMFNKC